MNWAKVGAMGSILEGVTSVANLGFQLANSRYQKRLQEKIFEREDNATQRRVADLKLAGLSPVLAAGSAAGSGGTVQVGTPQIEGFGDKMLMALQSTAMEKNIAKTDVEILKNHQEIEYLKTQQLKALAEIKGINVNTSQKWIDLQLQRETNTTSNNTGLSGLIKNYNGVGKIIVPAVKNQFKQGWEDTKKRSRERSEQDKKDPIFKYRIHWFD